MWTIPGSRTKTGKSHEVPLKGQDRFVGTLKKSVEVPRKFDLHRALRQIWQAFREELEKAIAKALRTARYARIAIH